MFQGASALLSSEYGTSTGYINGGNFDAVNDISNYFNQPIQVASTYGDPHINTLNGETYELPNIANIYRMLQGDDLIINASVSKLSNERN